MEDSEMASKKLCLSRVNRKIGGVCGGIAEYFGVDSTLIRIITLVLIFAVGSGLMLYLIAWLIMPACDDPYL